jgi:hypothetical protein
VLDHREKYVEIAQLELAAHLAFPVDPVRHRSRTMSA